MNRMLEELSRWGRVGPAAAASSRWLTWARALAGRWGHTIGRVPRPGMVLLPAWTAGAPGERHQHVHWSVSRNLRLAIRPILVALSRIEAAPVAAAATSPPVATRASDVAPTEQRVEVVVAPLQRVVVSAVALEAGSASGPLARPAQAVLAVDAGRRTLQWVVEERRRIEQWTPSARPGRALGPAPPDWMSRGAPPAAAPALARRPALASTVVATAGRQSNGQPPTAATPPGWPPPMSASAPSVPDPGRGGGAPAVAAGSIDVRQLTEQVVRQIDREIIAHRERMGRI
jgi:hypothetical protein